VISFPQLHPQGSTGFRIEESGKSLVYVTDCEGGEAHTDRMLLENAAGADLLIMDAQYTPVETAARRGWGHGDWRRACSVAADAGVKRLLLFHHDPSRTDAQLSAIEKLAQQIHQSTEVARERSRFRL
jgi:phosphoribosyl 1,2-cyclic phosphodiesterase